MVNVFYFILVLYLCYNESTSIGSIYSISAASVLFEQGSESSPSVYLQYFRVQQVLKLGASVAHGKEWLQWNQRGAGLIPTSTCVGVKMSLSKTITP